MMPAVLLIDSDDLPAGVSMNPISSVISFQKSTGLSAERFTVELPRPKEEPPPPVPPWLPPPPPPPPPPPWPPPCPPPPAPPEVPEPSVAVFLPIPIRERREEVTLK